jgi:peptidoglycan hydrolase-like protein with peptidoglycan-binding domain
VNLKRPLYGPDDPRGPTRGRDVVAIKRGLSKVETSFFPRPPAGFDDVYNRKTADAVKTFQRLNEIAATGHLGQATLDALWPYMDAYARLMYRAFVVPKPKPIPPPLVEPNQGWASLHSSLYAAFSIGRSLGFSDLGTYNPNSKLPSGAPSDHALHPARAFDLGIDPDVGYAHDAARAYFHSMIGRAEIGYVILGDRIWSRSRASEGVRRYTGGGHANHVHVSGNR